MFARLSTACQRWLDVVDAPHLARLVALFCRLTAVLALAAASSRAAQRHGGTAPLRAGPPQVGQQPGPDPRFYRQLLRLLRFFQMIWYHRSKQDCLPH